MEETQVRSLFLSRRRAIPAQFDRAHLYHEFEFDNHGRNKCTRTEYECP